MTLELLNDPEIAEAATDPEGMAVIQDALWLKILLNSAVILQHLHNMFA